MTTEQPAIAEATPLGRLLRERILREGPMTFRDFMESCLYEPGHGYYCSLGEKIGKGGDFYTSACFTSLFGEMLARQFEEMWDLLDRQPFTIVEYGAGTGLLARDILGILKGNRPLYRDLRYVIVERSPVMRAKEKQILPEKVSWLDDLRDLGGLNGCIFSNELVDNFSVYRVVMDKELMEVFVNFDGGFVEELRPAGPALREYILAAGLDLPQGHYMEINLQARGWIGELAVALRTGFVMTIDYGYPVAALLDDRWNSGTLACYHDQKRNFDPYRHIGEQDITAHVDFSALSRWGRECGLECCGFTGQANFLRSLGLISRISADPSADKYKHFLINILLRDMGNKFRILIQQKGLHKPRLSGLMFAERFV